MIEKKSQEGTEATDPIRLINELPGLKTKQLQVRHQELFGEATGSKDKQGLIKKISKHLRKTLENQRSATTEPVQEESSQPAKPKHSSHGRDPRIPEAGTVLTRRYKHVTYTTKVLEDGFEYDGKCYPTLSAVARVITGMWWSGFSFWKLNPSKN